jgi:hypothetical protein
MKPCCSNQRNRALALTEVVVVIVLLAILLSLACIGGLHLDKKKAQRIQCVNNLKQIVLAHKMWPGDQSDKYPMQVSVTNGGVMELVASGNVAADFLAMSNEIGDPKLLICPADSSRIVATNYSTDLSNSKISYFACLDAAEEYPQRFLCGDDNFAIGGVPVKSGLLEFSTNAPISWTAARHVNQGNIGLTDGAVLPLNNQQLAQKLTETDLATNRLAIP